MVKAYPVHSSRYGNEIDMSSLFQHSHSRRYPNCPESFPYAFSGKQYCYSFFYEVEKVKSELGKDKICFKPSPCELIKRQNILFIPIVKTTIESKTNRPLSK